VAARIGGKFPAPGRAQIPGLLVLRPVSQPAQEVGGDFYDYCRCPAAAAVLLGDVAGEGVPAALIMDALQRCRIKPPFDRTGPGRRILRLNNSMQRLAQMDRFVHGGRRDPGPARTRHLVNADIRRRCCCGPVRRRPEHRRAAGGPASAVESFACTAVLAADETGATAASVQRTVSPRR